MRRAFCFFMLLSLSIWAQEPPKPEDTRVQNLLSVMPRTGEDHLDLSSDWQMAPRESNVTNYADFAAIFAPEKEMDPQNMTDAQRNFTDGWTRMASPTSVHRTLFQNGILPDPFVGKNSERYRATENKIWYYRKTFTLPKKWQSADGRISLTNGFALLSFDGVDYFARVWVNGKCLGVHEGLFGGPEFEVGRLLNRGGENEIIVGVSSVKRTNPKHCPTHPIRYVLPWSLSGGVGVEPFFPHGVWRGVRMDFVRTRHLERPYLTVDSIREENGKTIARMRLDTEILCNAHSLQCKMKDVHPGMMYDERSLLRLTFQLGKETFVREFPVQIPVKRGWVCEHFELENPQLWYPNGLGEQALYDVTLELIRKRNEEIETTWSWDGEVLDTLRFRYGIRKIEWVESAGPKITTRWTNWQCVINNQKVFLKGCNWMPVDVLLDLPREKYRWYLSLARDAGIRLFRIWGAGLQESEYFYDLCDEFGILVWQDFPMANWDSDQFPLDVFESQILHSIWRLRNRTSLAVWCGGNEFYPYGHGNSEMVGVMERSIQSFDPERKFLRASPDCGSVHAYPDWDPCWTKREFVNHPFLSECGIHSVVNALSIRGNVNPDEFQYLDRMADPEFSKLAPEILHHFVEYIPERMPRMLTRTSHMVPMKNLTLDDLCLGSQLGAGEFYQILSEGVQTNYPRTTGMMPWVFARLWPSFSAIQLVDGCGRPVAPYYFLKRTYEPKHVQLDLEYLMLKAGTPFPARVQVLNMNGLPAFSGDVSVKILNDAFQTLYEKTASISVPDGPSFATVEMNAFPIPEEKQGRFYFVLAEYHENGKLVSRSFYMPRVMPQLEDRELYKKYTRSGWGAEWLPANEQCAVLKTQLQAGPQTTLVSSFQKTGSRCDGRYQQEEYRATVKNTGTVPAWLVRLELDDPATTFMASDNFFCLLPGEERTLTLVTREEGVEKPSEKPFVFRSWNVR